MFSTHCYLWFHYRTNQHRHLVVWPASSIVFRVSAITFLKQDAKRMHSHWIGCHIRSLNYEWAPLLLTNAARKQTWLVSIYRNSHTHWKELRSPLGKYTFNVMLLTSDSDVKVLKICGIWDLWDTTHCHYLWWCCPATVAVCRAVCCFQMWSTGRTI